MSSFKGFRFKLCMFTLILLSLTSLVACGEKAPEPPAALTVEALKNAEYQSEWPADGVAKLIDGIYREKYMEGAASELVISFAEKHQGVTFFRFSQSNLQATHYSCLIASTTSSLAARQAG